MNLNDNMPSIVIMPSVLEEFTTVFINKIL